MCNFLVKNLIEFIHYIGGKKFELVHIATKFLHNRWWKHFIYLTTSSWCSRNCFQYFCRPNNWIFLNNFVQLYSIFLLWNSDVFPQFLPEAVPSLCPIRNVLSFSLVNFIFQRKRHGAPGIISSILKTTEFDNVKSRGKSLNIQI